MHAVDRHDAPVSEATTSSTQHIYYVSELVELGHGVWRHARGDPRIEARKTGAFFADLPPGVLRFSVDRFPLSDIAHHGTTNPTLFWKGSKANDELYLGK